MQKKLLLFVCLLFSFLIVNSQFSVVHAPYIGENCALYLPMNEGSGIITYDQSGNGNNGSLLPLIIGPTWVDGKYGKALSFDGSNDYVEIPSVLSLTPNYISISLWIKGVTISNCRVMSMMSAIRSTVTIYITPEGKARWEFRGVNDGGTNQVGTVTVNDGAFHLIIIKYDGVKGYLFVDGNLDVSNNYAGGVLDWAGVQHVYVGRGTDGYYTNGIEDEVRIYNRALTQAEITVLYNAGFTSTYSETLAFSESLVQKQEQKQVLTQVFSYSDGSTIKQEQKYALQEIVTTTTTLTYGAEIPITFLEVFNSETLHITDTLRIWQEQQYIFPVTLTFNEAATFQNFVLELYTYINEVLAVAAIAFILAVTALALVLVYQRQKD